MEGVVLSPFYLFHLNITCFPSWEQLLKERVANRGTLFPVFFLLHYFILPFQGGFVSFHFDAKHLYLHPTSFSGVMDEANVPPLRELLSKAQTFRCDAVDFYEEYFDLSDEEYRAALESKREEITDFILRQCRTKSTRLYITESIAPYVAQHFEIRRLCDKDRINAVGNRFASELIAQLIEHGRLSTNLWNSLTVKWP